MKKLLFFHQSEERRAKSEVATHCSILIAQYSDATKERYV